MTDIRKVLVIYKTHLDIGFTDFSKNVVRRYMEEFIPDALTLAEKLRRCGAQERLVWTTGSWLIYEYLRTHSVEENNRLSEGIRNGDIRWHDLPFTTHTELMNADLFEYGLSLSQKLDNRFGRKTIAAKMTDVPGHTKAMIPYLRKAGIEFLHIGVNPASTVPEVPPLFRWQADNGDVLTVMYQKDYGEYTRIGQSDTAVCFAHTGDNLGVQSEEAIRQIFADLRERLPGAEIIAADLNDLAYAVRAVEDTLPIITDEIGDTWIHGVGTDPKKVCQFRALERLYTAMPDGADKDALASGLLMIPEHTWGLDVKTHLKDHAHYDRTSFACIKDTAPNYRKMEASWKEQRAYLYNAVAALSEEWRLPAEARLAEAERVETVVAGLQPYTAGESITLGNYRVQFGAAGEIVSLTHGNLRISDADHPLLRLMYEQFSGEDYKRFFRQYNRLDVEWAREDFTKPGMDTAAPAYRAAVPEKAHIFADAERVVVQYQFPDWVHAECGCPRKMEMLLTVDKDALVFDLAWFDKPANRISEALWIGFEPCGDHKQIRKLGAWIDPCKVVSKGQCRLHATDYGVRYDSFEIETIDSALVAPQEPSLLNFCDDKPDTGKVWFNLYNNVWGTNFPMWYAENARFRFVIRIRKKEGN